MELSPALPVNLYKDDPVLLMLVRIGGCLSVVGSLFIIVSYCIFRRSRKFSRKLLLFLTIADLGASLGWLMSGFHVDMPLPDRPGTLCVIQGYVLQFFYLASFLWTACFAFHLFQLIWIKNRRAYKLGWRYHVLSWGIPGGICIYFGIKQYFKEPGMGYTQDRPWCWITSSSVDRPDKFQWETFAFFYIPLVSILLFNLCLYVCLVRRLHNNLSSMEYKIRQRLVLYIAVFIFLTGWGLANRIYEFLDPDKKPSKFLLNMDAFCGPLQGFCNAIVYGINQKLRERYRRACCGQKGYTDSDYDLLPNDAFTHAEYGTVDNPPIPPTSPGI